MDQSLVQGLVQELFNQPLPLPLPLLPLLPLIPLHLQKRFQHHPQTYFQKAQECHRTADSFRKATL